MTSMTWQAALADVKSGSNKGGSTVIKEGWYDAILTDIESRRSKNGAPQLVMHLTVTAEEGAAVPMRNWITFTTAGAEYAIKDVVKMFDDSEIADWDQPTPDPDNNCVEVNTVQMAEAIEAKWVGGDFRVLVKEEEYQGRPSNSIGWFDPSKTPAGSGSGGSKSGGFDFG